MIQFLPQWTRRVVMDGSGRDPLGLSRVSDKLTSFLLPSIITTTDRARYYSFYTWVWADIVAWEAEIGTRADADALRTQFQRREAAFALASFLDRKSDLPIVGIRQVESRVGGDDDDISLDFRVLPSNPFGGYGQYYGGCLHALGLTVPTDDGRGEKPTPYGYELAARFTGTCASAPYVTDDSLRQKSHVSCGTLRKSAETFSLDGLGAPSAKHEREALIRLFFQLGESPTPGHPLNRQASLALFLHVLSAYEQASIPVLRREVDEYAVFWPHYYGSLRTINGDWVEYQAPESLLDTQGYWRQFCAHQFAAYALEEFLAGIVTALGAHPNGLTRSELSAKLAGPDFLEFLRKHIGADCPAPQEFLSALDVLDVANSAMSKAAYQRFSGRSALNEWTLGLTDGLGSAQRLGRAFALMAILYAKWRGREDDSNLAAVEVMARQEFWLGTPFPWIEEWLSRGPSWEEAIESLIAHVLNRHDTVKFQKRKLDATWVEESNGRLTHQQDLEPDFRSSRHGNATTILQDLGLIGPAKPDEPMRLTQRGRQVLSEVINLRR